MSERLGPGSTFAGCRIEAVAGRGGMGVVFRATQLALERPVALKAIVPEMASDRDYRERFQRESHLAASIEHPNVIPVYEAGDLEGTLYLIMRWVQGTDLRRLLTDGGRLSPGHAIGLLAPVASALGAAHRRGLVHRDVKPANVLIATDHGDDERHVYLTDFGIALRTDGESMTRTGMFVGTLDYMAPERFEGGKGDARSDIYALGCMLFEALTGHVPYDRPTDLSKMFAHVNDPIPSARAEVDAIPAQFDALIQRAMAKRPEDRYATAGELATALADTVRELDTAERATAMMPSAPQPTVVQQAPPPPPSPLPATAVPRAPHTAHTAPTAQTPGTRRRSLARWLAALALVAVAAVVVVALSSGGGGARSPGRSTPGGGSSGAGSRGATRLEFQGSGLAAGTTIELPAAAGSLSIGSRNLWAALSDGRLDSIELRTADRREFRVSGSPVAIAAGSRALWVAEGPQHALAQLIGANGALVHATHLGGAPVSLAQVASDSTAWVSDASGTTSHVALGGGTLATVTGAAATGLAVGEGWVWAIGGSDLFRIGTGSSPHVTTFLVGGATVSVTLDNGVWMALADGSVVRFDPRSGRLAVNGRVHVAAGLAAIAALDKSPSVWAISKTTDTLYEIATTGAPKVAASVRFPSRPLALAVTAGAVWVATADRRLTEIRVS
jgi:Protein kinase domain